MKGLYFGPTAWVRQVRRPYFFILKSVWWPNFRPKGIFCSLFGAGVFCGWPKYMSLAQCAFERPHGSWRPQKRPWRHNNHLPCIIIVGRVHLGFFVDLLARAFNFLGDEWPSSSTTQDCSAFPDLTSIGMGKTSHGYN